jgi:nucleoside-diphosphate-sugar epimerase
MRIAIFGATSQIAKDLVRSFHLHEPEELVLYGRRPDAVNDWLSTVGLAGRWTVASFDTFNAAEHFDAILNFVGVSNPAQTVAMGASIFEVTLQYDDLALNYVKRHPHCRYVFLSSGAAYGSNFDKPADSNTKAAIAVNCLQPQDWYGIAKLHAEARHRALASLPIIDVRVFNYFSHTQDMAARFIITDIFRAIRDKVVLQTSADYIVRDYVHPADFRQLVGLLLRAPPANTSVDCYSKAPVDKPTLLAAMKEKFALHYQIQEGDTNINASGKKPFYYSLNRRAEDFGYAPTLSSLEGIETEMRTAISLHQ